MNIGILPLYRRVFIVFALIQTMAIHVDASSEITKEQFDAFPEAVGGGFAYDKDKIYCVKGKIIQVGPDYVQLQSLIDDQAFGVVKITPEFIENFPGQKGTIVFFLSEFKGYANFETRIGGSIRLGLFEASHYLHFDNDSIQVVTKELAEKVAASIPRSEMSPPKTNGNKPVKSDDSVKIKIAELKGELAAINSKIDAERKRWKDASDLINSITNNRTQPVIRNSPDHVRMYEAQVIIKEVEEKAPDLKQQKAKIETILKELE